MVSITLKRQTLMQTHARAWLSNQIEIFDCFLRRSVIGANDQIVNKVIWFNVSRQVWGANKPLERLNLKA